MSRNAAAKNPQETQRAVVFQEALGSRPLGAQWQQEQDGGAKASSNASQTAIWHAVFQAVPEAGIRQQAARSAEQVGVC